MPYQHLIQMYLFVLCRESRYFENIVKFIIFRLRTIYNFFQVWYATHDKNLNASKNVLSYIHSPTFAPLLTMIFLLLYILPTYLAQDQQVTLPCDESCAVEKELDYPSHLSCFPLSAELSLENDACTWPITVQLDACPGHLIKLQFRPEDSVS